MSINHTITIIDRGPTYTSIKLDDHEVKGVVAYKVQRDMDSLPHITFTVIAHHVEYQR
jgi:hypothetical protein